MILFSQFRQFYVACDFFFFLKSIFRDIIKQDLDYYANFYNIGGMQHKSTKYLRVKPPFNSLIFDGLVNLIVCCSLSVEYLLDKQN
jgi:hypothetical protein